MKYESQESSILELKSQRSRISFDMRPLYESKIDDLDSSKLDKFFQKSSSPSSMAKLLSYHLMVEEHSISYPSIGGILLFGKNPQTYFPEGIIISTHMKGVSGREVIATTDCKGTIIEQLDTAMDFIVGRLYKSFVIEGIRRKETLEIPEIAIREIVINALVHRNYNIPGPIKIAIFNDRVEVFSPGGFPGPLNPDNLKMGITYIRNNVIARVFREMGIMEKLGSGFITVFDSYAKANLPTPQILEGENFIKCILPRNYIQERPKEPKEVKEQINEGSWKKILKKFLFFR